ncbi:MAG: bga, partial [Frondihabitans sp.]|nr:bga [Frondihabitans sp.]
MTALVPTQRSATTPATLTSSEGSLYRNGIPHQVLSGSLHYFRVHPEQWKDRLERVAAMGLNTIDTYIPWNFHQRHRNNTRFSGWQNVEAFVALAGDVGLDVIVRPGPYICAEWDNGGLPAWVTRAVGNRVRTSDPEFLDLVDDWFGDLIPRLAGLQASNGGPIVGVQVENEYGSFGDDAAYLDWLHDRILDLGINELLYTADGPTDLMLDGGTLDGIVSAVTLGTKPEDAYRLLRDRRPNDPFFVAEFWNGWFDHWGENHHVRDPRGAAAVVDDIVNRHGSVSLYMAHGGTNFGLTAGANHDGTRLQSTITSYDSDAPVSEHGALMPKFFAFRDVFLHATGRAERIAPPAPEVLAPRHLPVRRGAALLPALRSTDAGVNRVSPLTFDQLDLVSGLMLYEATPRLPARSSRLSVRGLRDRAHVYLDGEFLGVLADESSTVELPARGASAKLELLVENLGRINYGPRLGEDKGILNGVQIDRRLVHGWTMRTLPLDEWSGQQLANAGEAAESSGTTGFATATLEVKATADAFLALPGFGNG